MSDEATRELLAKTIYESTEAARAKEEGEPGIWTPWEQQTSRREQRIFRAAADAVMLRFKGKSL